MENYGMMISSSLQQLINNGPAKRLRFWTWWLTHAVPAAWNMEYKPQTYRQVQRGLFKYYLERQTRQQPDTLEDLCPTYSKWKSTLYKATAPI